MGKTMVLAASLAALLTVGGCSKPAGSPVSYSFFRKQVEQGNVSEVTFHGQVLTGTWKKVPPHPEGPGQLEPEFSVTLPSRKPEQLVDLLQDHGVAIQAESAGPGI